MSMEFIVDNISVCDNCFYKYNPPNPKLEVVIERIDDEDRISNLPDVIIGNVLSRIPTRHAVQTSVLSRNWKYKWTSIHNICVDGPCKSFVAENLSPSFINGVNMILGLTHEKIRNFHLFCGDKCDIHQLTTWISAVLRRGVQNVVVDGNINGFIVTLADYSALEELKLSLRMCILEVSVNDYFPNLRKLCLDGTFEGFQIINHLSDDTGQLLLNFPVLQYLELNYCKFLNVNSVEIRAPELVTFKAHHSYDLDSDDCVIKIYAPKLLKFYSSGGCVTFSDLYAPLVQYVDLRHQQKRSDFLVDQARAILKEVPDMTWLLLYHADVQSLVEQKQDLPNFDRLVRLEVNSSRTKPLLELLHTMPNLEYLNISFWTFNYEYKLNGPLPLCIVFNLKEVKFMNFYGGSSQIDLIKLFLENAKKLERVIVYLMQPVMTEREINFHLSTLTSMSSARVIISEKPRLTSFEQEFLEAE